MRYGLIVVEGWADLEFTVAVLKHLGVKEKVKKTGAAAGFWEPLIPKTLPQHKLLWERLKIPRIVQSDEISIAVYAVGGYTNFNDINFFLKLSPGHFSQLSAFGVVFDADKGENDDKDFISVRANEVIGQIPNTPAPLPTVAGTLIPGDTCTGIYIMPNNKEEGALEKVLIDAGAIAYPDLMENSQKFVDANVADHRESFNPEKSKVSAAASILQPDASTNISIRDDRWVCAETYKSTAMVSQFVDFLAELLGIDKPA